MPIKRATRLFKSSCKLALWQASSLTARRRFKRLEFKQRELGEIVYEYNKTIRDVKAGVHKKQVHGKYKEQILGPDGECQIFKDGSNIQKQGIRVLRDW